MPNQNECDHEIGVSGANNCVEAEREYRFSRQHFVTLSEANEWPIDNEYRHNYCPLCGAKIDWDKIKEEK